MDEENVYTRNGYLNRKDYLNELAEDYGHEKVYALADILGPNEDFDGLVTSLQDSENFEF